MGRSRRPFNNPFAANRDDLKKSLRRALVPRPPPPRAPAQAMTNAPGSDEDLFLEAVRDVQPVEDPRGVVRPKLPPRDAQRIPIHDEDAEVLAELADLVAGETHFDISNSDEFIEGAVDGLDRRILRRLRRGDYAYRGHIDLHGLNSKDQIPVLKGHLRLWLQRGRIAKAVLAFSTARPHDGGAGAMYVLLRR